MASTPSPGERPPPPKRRLALGWAGVVFCTLIGALWAFWGGVENFHEGWYHRSVLANVAMMLGQYLAPALVLTALCVIAVRWPRTGAALCLLAGVALASWTLGSGRMNLAVALILVPLLVVGLLFWFGRPRPRRLAYAVAAGVPLVTLLAAAVPGAIRVAGRVDDGDYGVRLIPGNGVRLLWAAQGPGWPLGKGATWQEAARACRHLSRDGVRLAATPQGRWRLPTAEEAVRSQVRHGRNAGGTWDPATGRASYTTPPDKETPLWNPHSPVIYWWTATEAGAGRAYRIAYNGDVRPWPTQDHPDYLTFRCVATPPTG